MRRGDASSCSYAAPGTRKKNQSQGASSPDDMQNRIDRLEGLVLSLMTNGAQSAGPAAAAAAISRSQSDSAGSSSLPHDLDREDDNMIKEEDEDDESDVEGVTNSLGVLKVDANKGQSLYVGDSHWHLVLADVSYIILFSSFPIIFLGSYDFGSPKAKSVRILFLLLLMICMCYSHGDSYYKALSEASLL